jgi:hypothetical protein
MRFIVKMLKKEVKAQVTTFVIIALILIIAVGIYFGVREFLAKNQPDVPEEIVTNEAGLIKEFTDNCLKQVSKEAIVIAGERSGYTNIPETLKTNPFPYKADVFSNAVYSLPYWYHFSDDNIFESHKPALCSYSGDCGIVDFGEVSVQENIEDYVEENLDSCINNYASFNGIADVKELGNQDVAVQIIEDKVIVRLNYPIEVSSFDSESKTNIDAFSTEHNVPLQQMFVLSMDIVESQSRNHFIEDNTLNLISAFSGLDGDKLPPMSHLSFMDFSQEFWIRRQVEETMRYEVLPFVGLTKVVNALNTNPVVPYADEEYRAFAQGFYESFHINIKENQTYNYTVDIYYPDSDIEFYIDNGEEVLRSKEMKGVNPNLVKLFKLAIQEYSYDYNLAFPVIITVRDDEAFNGEGYSFSFAIEANIRNNLPLTQNMTFARFDSPSRLKVDDPSALVDKNITVNVKDRHTNQPIDEALVIYNCGKDYFVGNTITNNYESELTTKFPYCAVGGYIKVMKEGYATVIEDFDNDELNFDPKKVYLEMWPAANKTFKFFKRTQDDLDSMQTIEDKLAYKHVLSSNEELLFNIQKIKEDPREDDFPLISFMLVTNTNATELTYNADAQVQQVTDLYEAGEINQSMYDSLIEGIGEYKDTQLSYEQDFNVELVPGMYEVDMSLMSKGPYNIPRKTETMCLGQEVAGVCIGEEEEVVYDELNLSVWVTGETKFNLTIHENRLYTGNDVMFFTPYLPAPTSWSSLKSFDLEEYVTDIEDWKLQPYYE